MIFLTQLTQSGSTETNNFGAVVLVAAVVLVIIGLATKKR